jgi:hypothetical protein
MIAWSPRSSFRFKTTDHPSANPFESAPQRENELAAETGRPHQPFDGDGAASRARRRRLLATVARRRAAFRKSRRQAFRSCERKMMLRNFWDSAQTSRISILKSFELPIGAYPSNGPFSEERPRRKDLSFMLTGRWRRRVLAAVGGGSVTLTPENPRRITHLDEARSFPEQ